MVTPAPPNVLTVKLNIIAIDVMILHVMLEHLAHFASRCPAQSG